MKFPHLLLCKLVIDEFDSSFDMCFLHYRSLYIGKDEYLQPVVKKLLIIRQCVETPCYFNT